MSDPLVVDLFVEDVAHEVFVGGLARRIAPEEHVALPMQARSTRRRRSWSIPPRFARSSASGRWSAAGKCPRDHYKQLLPDAVPKAHQPETLRGIEFAPELAEAMNLYRAGRNDSSLTTFVGDLRARIRQSRESAER